MRARAWLIACGIGCGGPSGGPTPTDVAGDVDADADTDADVDTDTDADTDATSASTGETAVPRWTLALRPEQVLASGAVDQHHATVAVDADGAGMVAWADGERPGTSRVRPFDELGVVGPDTALASPCTKPDVVFDGPAALVGAQTDHDGITLFRVDRADLSTTRGRVADEVDAQGNNSVDITRRGDGSVAVTWWDDGAPGTVRLRSLDASLAREPGFDVEVAHFDVRTDPPPDVDALPDGRVGLAWVEQSADASEDTLFLDLYTRGGARELRVPIDAGAGVDAPRRPTLAWTPAGFAVTWRERRAVPPRPSSAWLALVREDGALLAPTVLLEPGDADEPVVTRVDDDHVWVTWTALADGTVGHIRGALFALPSGDRVFGPVELSTDAVAARPHTAAAPMSGSGHHFAIAVSWEQPEGGGPLVIRGRTGVLSLE